MSESDVIDAPDINPENSGFDEKWRREYVAFLRLLPELLKTHRDKFVAIHNGAVSATADTYDDAALKAYELVGYVPLHVGQVLEGPPAPVRLPSPRIGRRIVSQ